MRTAGLTAAATLLGSALMLSVASVACNDTQRPAPGPDTLPGSGLSYEIAYATYVGGARFEEAREPVLAGGGRLLFGVRTYSGDMPTTAGALQAGFGGGDGDTWIGILDPNGERLEAATYLGGSGMERPPYGMALAANGDIVVTSGTNSENLPVTAGAYRERLASPVNGGYVCRLSPDLSARRWCTYIAGWPRGGLGLDADDNVVVVGRALDGSPFEATPGAYQTAKRGTDDAFVLKLAADGSRALFKTRLGGTGEELGEVAVSVKVRPGRIVLGGISQSRDFPTTPGAAHRDAGEPRDAFVAWLSPDGSELLYSTLLGGSAQDLTEHSDALLPDGSLVTGGETFSADLPGASGELGGEADGFVARLSASGAAFDFVRYIGGSDHDRIVDRTVDASGRIVVVGQSSSRDFPVTAGALQTDYGGGPADGVLVILDPDGEILYSTYLGGDGEELVRGVATGPAGEIYLVGFTTSDDFPVAPGAFQTGRGGAEDGFALKLAPTP